MPDAEEEQGPSEGPDFHDPREDDPWLQIPPPPDLTSKLDRIVRSRPVKIAGAAAVIGLTALVPAVGLYFCIVIGIPIFMKHIGIIGMLRNGRAARQARRDAKRSKQIRDYMEAERLRKEGLKGPEKQAPQQGQAPTQAQAPTEAQTPAQSQRPARPSTGPGAPAAADSPEAARAAAIGGVLRRVAESQGDRLDPALTAEVRRALVRDYDARSASPEVRALSRALLEVGTAAGPAAARERAKAALAAVVAPAPEAGLGL